MKNEILMSQLIGLISASNETNRVQINSGDMALLVGSPEEIMAKECNGMLSISWARGTGFGCKTPCLYMKVRDLKKSPSSYQRFVLRAYHYEGDNCNERTRFLYGLMADDVDIIDDLGICGHGSEIGKTYLTKLSANEYGVCMVNARGRTPMFCNGHWTYKEEQ